MIELDSKFSEEEKNEIYYHELFKSVEQGDELDDYTYECISLAQVCYCISKRSVTLAKRATHRRRLGRVECVRGVGGTCVAWYNVPPRQLHSKGGRKVGSRTSLDEATLWNVENYVSIARTCAKEDRFVEFRCLFNDLNRAGGVPGVGKVNKTYVLWLYRAMREKYGVESGSKKIKEAVEKYHIVVL